MKANIQPSYLKQSRMDIPPSKSLAHRAVICAALADGISRIDNIDYSVDVLATLNAMETLGAKVLKEKDHVLIQGISSIKQNHKVTLHCEESGSTLRFLIPLCSLCGHPVVFRGKRRLMQRPQSVYKNLFEQANASFVQTEDSIEISGALHAGAHHLRGDVSSQFITGLLFMLPLLESDSILFIDGPFESKSYVELTIQMMHQFGVEAQMIDHQILIPGNQRYKSAHVHVEGDYSQFAFFASLGVLCGPVEIYGISKNSMQGDRAVLQIIEQMNGMIQHKESSIICKPSALSAIEIDLADCPDLGPALMMLASFAQGTTKIVNAGRLRIKESDRIEAMETELRKCGVEICSTDDTIWICGRENWELHEPLFGHNDHRIVMALSIGLIASKQSGSIEGAEAVSKSYPGFFDDLKKLGVDVYVE